MRLCNISLGPISALVFVVAFLPTARTQAQTASGEASPAAPCSFPSGVDTTGWQTERWYSEPDGRRLMIRIPPSFQLDRHAFFEHGGKAWLDGRRRLLRYTGGGSDCIVYELKECSECESNTAGIPIRIVTGFHPSDSLYLVSGFRPKLCCYGDHDGIYLQSPDSADLAQFVAIVGTIREEASVSAHGILYMGGNRISPPYRLTFVNYRLTLNGLQLPDIRPFPGIPADMSGELEVRRAIVADLCSYRDSLAMVGVEWPQAVGLIKTRAQTTLGVGSVATLAGTVEPHIEIKWPWGYDMQFIGREHAYQAGSHPGAYKETDRAISKRMEHLAALLERGSLVFLLGGGSEYVVEPKNVRDALRELDTLSKSQDLSARSQLIPRAVQAQIRNPLKLEPLE